MTDINTEEITIDYFDYREELEEETGITYGLYQYNDYKLALKKEDSDLGEVIEYVIVFERGNDSIHYKILSLEHGLTIINLLDKGSN